MSTRCNIEFYDGFEASVKEGVWSCTCEDQTFSKGPKGERCDHIGNRMYSARMNPLKSFSVEVPSRSRRGKTHTVTYAIESKSVQRLAARLYQHSDGYPCGIIPQLRRLEDIVSGKNQSKSIYGTRTNDPEWCAAEFINQFRQPGGGNVYVSQERHGDIAYLYKVYCHADGFHIEVYEAYGKIKDVTFKYHPITGEAVK